MVKGVVASALLLLGMLACEPPNAVRAHEGRWLGLAPFRPASAAVTYSYAYRHGRVAMPTIVVDRKIARRLASLLNSEPKWGKLGLTACGGGYTISFLKPHASVWQGNGVHVVESCGQLYRLDALFTKSHLRIQRATMPLIHALAGVVQKETHSRRPCRQYWHGRRIPVCGGAL